MGRTSKKVPKEPENIARSTGGESDATRTAATPEAPVAKQDQPDRVFVHTELARLLAASETLHHARECLGEAEALSRKHTTDPTVRMMLLQIKERAALTTGLVDQWAELLRDCPGDMRVVRHYATRLVKERCVEEAVALVNQHMPEQLDDSRQAIARAELLSDIKAHDESDALFRRLLAKHDSRHLRVAFAKRLAKRGFLGDAAMVLQPVAHTLAPDSKGGQLAAKLNGDYQFFRRFESEESLVGQDVKIVAMKQAILKFRHRVVTPDVPERAKSVALVTGSLGPGGAERQLTRLARQLQAMAEAGGREGLDGRQGTIGDVEVIVKQYTSDQGQSLNFFLGSLLEANVKVTEINNLPAVAAAHQPIGDTELLRLVGILPAQLHYGVTRLAPYLRERKFDVVSLWQDGTCLIGALAALLVDVPVIHLVFRGLPPNIRQERDRPEYATFYRAMAEIPSVFFVSNSKVGAVEYAKWLGLPVERFRVLYNGVPDLDTAGSDEDRQKWESFVSRTSDATETIGGVFRLEPDKRPMLWIKLAQRYLKRRPLARFVIVGDGRFQENVRAFAAKLGVADRLLLVGLSRHVGFWYPRMDVKLLLSRYEGLPNVLIEAQLIGVCAVSTPAGGAGECFIDGVTGHLLNCAENPNLEDACDKIASLVTRSREDASLKTLSKQRARMLFSIDEMISGFMDLCFPSVEPATEPTRDDVAENLVKI